MSHQGNRNGPTARHASLQLSQDAKREVQFTALSHAEAWAQLPERASGEQAPLPIWARILAKSMPRTAAAMLELDHLHRSCSPLDPELRGQIRWIAARANHCEYGKAHALADLHAAGLSQTADCLATGNMNSLAASRRAVLAFAHKLTVAPQTVTDAEVANLIEAHGEKQAVAMVLLLRTPNSRTD